MRQWGNEAMRQWGNDNGMSQCLSLNCPIAALPHCPIAPLPHCPIALLRPDEDTFAGGAPVVEDERRADALEFRHVEIQSIEIETAFAVEELDLLMPEAQQPERQRHACELAVIRVPREHVEIRRLRRRRRQLGQPTGLAWTFPRVDLEDRLG